MKPTADAPTFPAEYTWAEKLDQTCPRCHQTTHWTHVGGVTEPSDNVTEQIDRSRRGLTFSCARCSLLTCVPEGAQLVYYDEIGRCSCGREATHTTTVPLGGKLYRRCDHCAARTNESWKLRPLTPAERGN